MVYGTLYVFFCFFFFVDNSLKPSDGDDNNRRGFLETLTVDHKCENPVERYAVFFFRHVET